MAPWVVISLFLVKTLPLPATSWLPAHPPPSHPVGVLLLLATPVKKLSKMAGNPASYPVYSTYNELLLIAIDLWRNTCR